MKTTAAPTSEKFAHYRSISDRELEATIARLEDEIDALDSACWPGAGPKRDAAVDALLAAQLEAARRRV